MTTRQTREFAQRQVAAMDQFLSWAGDDPLMGPGLRARREEFARQVGELGVLLDMELPLPGDSGEINGLHLEDGRKILS